MKILVGFDGTNAAKEAIALAEQHARIFDATIILAFSMVGGPEVPRRDFEVAENSLEHEKSNLIDKNLPCDTIMSVRGLEAGEDLVRVAELHVAQATGISLPSNTTVTPVTRSEWTKKSIDTFRPFFERFGEAV